jgi:hypothetical protein
MTDVVTISFFAPGGEQAWIKLPWVNGRRLRDYLRDPRLRKYSLLARARREKVVNVQGRKVRLRDQLKAGDAVAFWRTGR